MTSRETREGTRTRRHLEDRAVRALFEHAIALSRETGCGLVQLTTDKARPEAFAFYESLGFTPSHVGMKLTL